METFKTICCFGDSLVEGEGDCAHMGGWVGRLAQKLDPNRGYQAHGHRIYNLGIGGASVWDMYHRLNEVSIRQPDMVILNGGANDIKICTEAGTEERCISLYQIRKHWRLVLDKLQAMKIPVLYVGHIEGFDDENSPIKIATWAEHTAWIIEECENRGFKILDKFALASEQFSHGCHPNGHGYKHMSEEIWRVAMPIIKQL